jgi:integrase/recombinase XerD
MLETYFVRPQTIDGIRSSWIGSEIERYVVWLAENGYAARSVLRRVPLLVAFGEFARARGARTVGDLPGHVDAFVAGRMAVRPAVRRDGRQVAKEFRGPVEQMLALVVPGFVRRSSPGERSGCRRRRSPRAA